MKILKRIPMRNLIVILAFLSLGAAYSARTMIEIGPVATVTGSFPEIVFDRTGSTGIDWEFEANQNFFEIGPEGEGSGDGNLKIDFNANEDALTLQQFGVVVNGQDNAGPVEGDELTVFGAVTDSSTVALALVDRSDTAGNDDGLSIAIESDDTFNLSGSANESTPNRIIQGSLAAPEDAITIQPTGMVSLGVPFSKADPFGLAIAPIKLRVPGSMFFDQKDPTDSSWLAGTSGDFFSVSDATTGSIPFRLEREAPTDSLHVTSNGNIGVGTSIPTNSLHVLRSNGSARLLVEETNATPEFRTLARLQNNGASKLEMTNTDTGRTWSLVADFNETFQIRQNGPNTANFAIRADGTFSFNNLGQSAMALNPQGNLRISGVLTEGSDRNIKENIEAVNPTDVLAKVVDLPLSTWNYIKDESDTQHLGPMAQDFHAAFGLGDDEKKIATLDTSGVALAAIQGLNLELKNRDEKIAELEEANQELLDRMERLEAMVEALSNR
jgi:hypothetical protein